MSLVIPTTWGGITPAARGKNIGLPFSAVGVFRLPTDPLYYSSLTLENIVVGSRYRVTRNSNSDELATGVASSTTEVVAGIPVYSSPMLMNIVVRKASNAPKYQPLETFTNIDRSGGDSYIVQIPDTIA
jgi:hypothetical protein